LQRLIFDRLGRFPWQCSECSYRFVSNERGTMKKKKKRHRSSSFDQTLLPLPPTRNMPAKRKTSPSPAEESDETED